jgi:hypothetical protein
MSNLSAVLRETGKHQEAEGLSRQAVAISAARFGPDHGETASHRTHLGACLIALGQYEEAERELLAAKRVLAPPAAVDRRRWISCAGNLQKLYAAWGKPELAAEYEAVTATTRSATAPSTAPGAALR